MGARTHPAPHLLSRYGPGHGSLYVEFVRNGWTNTHEEMLGGVRRQMLHAAVLDLVALVADATRRLCQTISWPRVRAGWVLAQTRLRG